MLPKVLHEILERHLECTREGEATFEIPEGANVTVFASAGQEALVIDRVRQILLADQVVMVSTSRDERYLLPYEELRAVRMTGGAGKRSAGYT